MSLIGKRYYAEYESRKAESQKKRVRTAGFYNLKYLDEIDRNEQLDGMKNILPKLETLDFIRQHRNIVLYGNPENRKTHIATVLGIKGVHGRGGCSVLILPHLITQIKECRSFRTLHALEYRLKNTTLLYVTSLDTYPVTRKQGNCCSITYLLERTENQQCSQLILLLKGGMKL